MFKMSWEGQRQARRRQQCLNFFFSQIFVHVMYYEPICAQWWVFAFSWRRSILPRLLLYPTMWDFMLCIQDELSTHFLCCGKQEQHSHYYLIYLWNILLALIFTKLELKLWQQNNLPTTWLKSVLSRNNDNEPKGEKERKKESERERERQKQRYRNNERHRESKGKRDRNNERQKK